MNPSHSSESPVKSVPIPGVWAVIVSYCGGDRLLTTVQALLNQVEHVHIVDNASTETTDLVLQQLSLMRDVSVNRLQRNMGIGFALNQGVESARAAGAQWVLTMDQDSTADQFLLEAYGKALSQCPELACFAPNVHNYGLGKCSSDKDIQFAITSGNLVKLELLQRVGSFDEGFFIDGVDLDFSLRIRSAGFRIRQVCGAKLYHQLGDKHTASGILAKFYTLHSPMRRYYMYRNHILLMRRHGLHHPFFMLKATLFQFLHLAAIFRFEGICRDTCDSIWAGIKAGIAGRTGPI